jgi:hypothetical protein
MVFVQAGKSKRIAVTAEESLEEHPALKDPQGS